MEETLVFGGKSYISIKQAAKESGYAKDYISQLCRAGKLDARLVGRGWYVRIESVLAHRELTRDVNKDAARDAMKDDSGEVAEQVQQQDSHPEDSHEENDEDENDITDSTQVQEVVQPSPYQVVRSTVDTSSDDRVPAPLNVPLEEFAMERAPNEFELERRNRQESLLSKMDVMFEHGAPVFYEDDAPLIPLSSKGAHTPATATVHRVHTSTDAALSPADFSTSAHRISSSSAATVPRPQRFSAHHRPVRPTAQRASMRGTARRVVHSDIIPAGSASANQHAQPHADRSASPRRHKQKGRTTALQYLGVFLLLGGVLLAGAVTLALQNPSAAANFANIISSVR